MYVTLDGRDEALNFLDRHLETKWVPQFLKGITSVHENVTDVQKNVKSLDKDLTESVRTLQALVNTEIHNCDTNLNALVGRLTVAETTLARTAADVKELVEFKDSYVRDRKDLFRLLGVSTFKFSDHSPDERMTELELKVASMEDMISQQRDMIDRLLAAASEKPVSPPPQQPSSPAAHVEVPPPPSVPEVLFPSPPVPKTSEEAKEIEVTAPKMPAPKRRAEGDAEGKKRGRGRPRKERPSVVDFLKGKTEELAACQSGAAALVEVTDPEIISALDSKSYMREVWASYPSLLKVWRRKRVYISVSAADARTLTA
jgi:hypothetical protein